MVLLFVHFRNARDAVRPELVLDSPKLEAPETEAGNYFLVFEGLKNHGRGPALNIFAHSLKTAIDAILFFDDGAYGRGIGAFAFVAPGSDAQRRFRILFKPSWFGEGELRVGTAAVLLRLAGWDLHGRQHVVEYLYSVMGARGRWQVQVAQRRPWIRSRLRLFLLVRYERLSQRFPGAWKRFTKAWEGTNARSPSSRSDKREITVKTPATAAVPAARNKVAAAQVASLTTNGRS